MNKLILSVVTFLQFLYKYKKVYPGIQSHFCDASDIICFWRLLVYLEMVYHALN
jgi:hypothetical protein